MKRTQWYSGVWEDVTHGINVACCSCGLVHDYTFKVVKGKKVFMVAHLDNRSTAQVRRRRIFRCRPVDKK